MRLRSEGDLLAAIARDRSNDLRVAAGIGDDCAVVATAARGQWQLLKTDAVVEGVHFAKGAKAEAIGWKAMMRPLSDFAAMSGVPEFALITIAIPSELGLSWVRPLYRGLRRAAGKFQVEIVGGETAATSGLIVIAVMLSGFVEKSRCILRSGGRSGDDLYVTGKLGGSIRGRHLRFAARVHESRWLSENFSPHAMIDLSDGLGTDLPRLAQASKLSFEIDEQAIPTATGASIGGALSDGEDYELLFALSPRQRERLKSAWRKRFPRLSLTRIGRLVPRSRKSQDLPAGYDHFANRR